MFGLVPHSAQRRRAVGKGSITGLKTHSCSAEDFLGNLSLLASSLKVCGVMKVMKTVLALGFCHAFSDLDNLKIRALIQVSLACTTGTWFAHPKPRH